MADVGEHINPEGKNAKPLFCRYCGSQFICANSAEHVEHEESQSHFERLAAGGVDDDRKAADEGRDGISPSFWRIGDVWDFDNIGQTRAVASALGPSGEEGMSGLVYVVCADCEKGPVGIRWAAGEPYYVSHSRVQYDKPEGAPEDGALPPGMTEDFLRSLIAQKEEQEGTQQGGGVQEDQKEEE